MIRYLKLLAVQLRVSTLLGMQYRFNFLLDGVIELSFMAGTSLLPLFIVFQVRNDLGGWTYGEALLVAGWFLMVHTMLDGAINPSLEVAIGHIRYGTLDFVLLKPADSQFLISTSRFAPWKVSGVLGALLIFMYAFHQLDRGPSLPGLLMCVALFVAAVVVLYSIWILTICIALFALGVNEITFLLNNLFDVARWPSSVFKGFWRLLFTFVLPFALMTTFPAEAMLGRLDPMTFVGALVGTMIFAALARWTWLAALGKYSSASS